MADQDVIKEFMKVRAELAVHQMILGQLLVSAVADTRDPLKTLAAMYEVLAARLDKLPISQGTPQADAAVAMTRERLGDFFKVLRQSLPDKGRR